MLARAGGLARDRQGHGVSSPMSCPSRSQSVAITTQVAPFKAALSYHDPTARARRLTRDKVGRIGILVGREVRDSVGARRPSG